MFMIISPKLCDPDLKSISQCHHKQISVTVMHPINNTQLDRNKSGGCQGRRTSTCIYQPCPLFSSLPAFARNDYLIYCLSIQWDSHQEVVATQSIGLCSTIHQRNCAMSADLQVVTKHISLNAVACVL